MHDDDFLLYFYWVVVLCFVSEGIQHYYWYRTSSPYWTRPHDNESSSSSRHRTSNPQCHSLCPGRRWLSCGSWQSGWQSAILHVVESLSFRLWSINLCNFMFCSNFSAHSCIFRFCVQVLQVWNSCPWCFCYIFIILIFLSCIFNSLYFLLLFLAYAELAKPRTRIFVCRVECLESTRKLGQRAFVDDV